MIYLITMKTYLHLKKFFCKDFVILILQEIQALITAQYLVTIEANPLPPLPPGAHTSL